ncbi:hypothetical protein QO190_06205 [Cloacibacterium sp. Arc13]|uniref:hypothetical protein n=1 Tax=unclassified Cloacibacterium TaxID=2620870 RepID=UPI00352C5E87
MARYKSILQFQGSIDGLVFYELNGVSVVRKKSGFNRDDFKTKENYARVRENSSEFGHCSKTGKMLRNAIYPYYKKCGDRYLYQKFAQLMTAIKDLDTISERGKRTVYQGLKTTEGKKLLSSFVFGKISSAKDFIKKTSYDEGISVQLNMPQPLPSLHLVSILPNYESYRFEVQEQKVSVDNGVFTFGSYFQEEEALQFVAIYEGEEILGMGFLR